MNTGKGHATQPNRADPDIPPLTSRRNLEGRTISVSAVQAGILEQSGWTLDSDDNLDALARYVDGDRQFGERLAGGIEPGPFVLVEHLLCVATQSTSGAGRKQDLTAEYEALAELPEMRNWFHKTLGASTATPPVSGPARIVSHDDTRTVIDVLCEGRRNWPPFLGGVPTVHELERTFTLVIRRAPWRDRAVRRLQVVETKTVEVHLDPNVVVNK